MPPRAHLSTTRAVRQSTAEGSRPNHFGMGLIIGLVIDIQRLLHGADNIAVTLRNHPGWDLPGVAFVFFVMKKEAKSVNVLGDGTCQGLRSFFSYLADTLSADLFTSLSLDPLIRQQCQTPLRIPPQAAHCTARREVERQPAHPGVALSTPLGFCPSSPPGSHHAQRVSVYALPDFDSHGRCGESAGRPNIVRHVHPPPTKYTHGSQAGMFHCVVQVTPEAPGVRRL